VLAVDVKMPTAGIAGMGLQELPKIVYKKIVYISGSCLSEQLNLDFYRSWGFSFFRVK
jgi:hypothetical protein